MVSIFPKLPGSLLRLMFLFTPLLSNFIQNFHFPPRNVYEQLEKSHPHTQGCGAGTQISGSGSRHLKFLVPAPAIQNCLGSGSTALLTHLSSTRAIL